MVLTNPCSLINIHQIHACIFSVCQILFHFDFGSRLYYILGHECKLSLCPKQLMKVKHDVRVILKSKRSPAVMSVYLFIYFVFVCVAGGDGGARGEEAHAGAKRAGEKERRRERETAGTERGQCKAEVLGVATRCHYTPLMIMNTFVVFFLFYMGVLPLSHASPGQIPLRVQMKSYLSYQISM